MLSLEAPRRVIGAVQNLPDKAQTAKIRLGPANPMSALMDRKVPIGNVSPKR